MTAEGRITTSRITNGDRILVEQAVTGVLDSTTKKLTGKNGVQVATVQGAQQEAVRSGRRTTTYTVFVTDLGTTRPAPPSQTWALAPVQDEPEPEAVWPDPALLSSTTEEPHEDVTAPTGGPTVRLLSDRERSNYEHAARNATSESGRTFWQRKAQGL